MAATTTPVMGLNKPARGDFNWDEPLNENWDKLDKLGAGQLPLLSWIDVDYVLTGDAALGWALQGSTLDGNTYTSLWAFMKAAYDRGVAKNEEHYGKTYSVRTDATTGLRFVTSTVYDQAFNAMGESLGHVVDTTNGAKTIRLRKSWRTYDLPRDHNASVGTVVDESLPNIKGTSEWTGVSGVYGSASGAFIRSVKSGGETYGGNGDASFIEFDFDASRSSSAYKNGAKVMPQTKYVLRYYKVGNTIVNQDQIDLGNVLEEVQNVATNSANLSLSNVKSNLDFVVESGTNYMKYKSGKLVQWGRTDYRTSNATQTISLYKPYKDTNYIITIGNQRNGLVQENEAGLLYDVTTTNFKVFAWGSRATNWIAIGKGA